MRGLENRVAVVTGGVRGIGRATVERLREEGMRVTALDVLDAEGEQLERELADEPAARYVPCDVTREQDVAVAFSWVLDEYGRIDLLVNNAGVNAYHDAASMTEEEWNGVMDIDLKGPWLCSKHALPAMREAGSGVIVNVSSIHAFLTTDGMFPYAAAKAGVVGLTRSLALDEAKHGIRVNAICPGYVRTRLIEEWIAGQPDAQEAERRILAAQPLGRIGTPSEIAAFIAFLASDDASYATGAAFLVDGGLSARFAT